jgi:hypothetical protein
MQVLGFDSSKYFTVVGQVRYLPESVEHYFDHLVDVPQVYVLVDSLRKLDRSDSEAVLITISFAILSSTWEACIAMATNY